MKACKNRIAELETELAEIKKGIKQSRNRLSYDSDEDFRTLWRATRFVEFVDLFFDKNNFSFMNLHVKRGAIFNVSGKKFKGAFAKDFVAIYFIEIGNNKRWLYSEIFKNDLTDRHTWLTWKIDLRTKLRRNRLLYPSNWHKINYTKSKLEPGNIARGIVNTKADINGENPYELFAEIIENFEIFFSDLDYV
jgi:hypothetical protein